MTAKCVPHITAGVTRPTIRWAQRRSGEGRVAAIVMSAARPPRMAAPTKPPLAALVSATFSPAARPNMNVTAPNGGRHRRSMTSTGAMKITLVMRTCITP